MAAVDVPQQGQLVQVRERRWVVADVVADELPSDVLEPTAQRQHLLTLRCVDDDAEVDESIQVVWEIAWRSRVRALCTSKPHRARRPATLRRLPRCRALGCIVER